MDEQMRDMMEQGMAMLDSAIERQMRQMSGDESADDESQQMLMDEMAMARSAFAMSMGGMD